MATHTAAKVTVGVIGPVDLVDRVVLTAGMPNKAEHGLGGVRLEPTAYRHEREAVQLAHEAAGRYDVLLYTGPLPYDLVQQEGPPPTPAAFIPLASDALATALMRCLIMQTGDPSRVSVDGLSELHVRDVYADLGLEPQLLQVRPYRGPESSEALVEFHEQQHRAGLTSLAVTGVASVHHQLAARGVPSARMLPSSAAIRAAVSAAALLVRGVRAEASQIAIGLVAVADLGRSRAETLHQWNDELRLAVHRELISEARTMGATVLPLDQETFLVVGTLGSLSDATDRLRTAPFVERLKSVTGVVARVGIGLGDSAQLAEVNARAALAQAPPLGHVVMAGSQLSSGAGPVSLTDAPAPRSIEVVRDLAQRLRKEGATSPVVVDAFRAAELLDVSERSARRILRSLTEEGLAWALPANADQRPGRPRQRYRLLLDNPATRHG